jgi:hypothetical protein
VLVHFQELPYQPSSPQDLLELDFV